jgi:predicted nucleic acid-binding protein
MGSGLPSCDFSAKTRKKADLTPVLILVTPLGLGEATDYVDSWLDQPFVEAVSPGPSHWAILRNLLAASGTAGNLTSDAHIAALAIEHKAAVYSTDHDFGRFGGVKHFNPIAPD